MRSELTVSPPAADHDVYREVDHRLVHLVVQELAEVGNQKRGKTRTHVRFLAALIGAANLFEPISVVCLAPRKARGRIRQNAPRTMAKAATPKPFLAALP